MGTVSFTKMHGLGNDYIYFDCIEDPHIIEDPSKVAIRFSDRHFGIGGDGIVLILASKEADFRMRMFNADGSEAEMCGNAIRCVGKFVYEKGYVSSRVVRVMTGAGILRLDLEPDPLDSGKIGGVRVDMGEPILHGRDIPVDVNASPARLSIAMNGRSADEELYSTRATPAS